MALNLTEWNRLTIDLVDRPEISDEVFETSRTLKQFQKSGLIEKGIKLPETYDWPLKTSNVGGSVWSSPFTVHTLNPQDPFAMAALTTKEVDQPVSLPIQAIEGNLDRPEKISDYLVGILESALEDFGAKMNQAIFNDGTDSLAIVGLRKIVATGRTYAGINSSTYSYWDALVYSADYTLRTLQNLRNSSSENFIRRELTKVWTKLENERAADPADYIILCPPTFRQAYADSAQDFLNINYSDQKQIDLATREVSWMGIPIIGDVDCPSTPGSYAHVYFINKKYLKLMIGKTAGDATESKGIFSWTGWKSNEPSQRTMAGLLVCRCVMPCKRPGMYLDMLCDGNTITSTISL